MRKISKIAMTLAAAAITAVSCMQDAGVSNELKAGGQPVTITMDPGLTRAEEGTHLGDVLDRAVESLRVLIYENRTGQLLWNFTPDDLTQGFVDGDKDGKHEMTLEIMTGTYDFVFIGNELSGYADDPVLGNLLANEDNFDKMSELRQLTFGFSAFPLCRDIAGTTELIPMVTFVPTVKVLGDNEIDSPSTGHITGTWDVELERVGIRIDIELTLTEDQYQNYLDSKLLLWDPARAAYLRPRSDNLEHNTAGDDNISHDAANILCNVQDELGAGDVPTGRKIVSGSYLLPERILAAANDTEANAMTIELFNSGAEPKGSGKSSPIWYNDEDDQPTWSFPRNTYLKLAGTVLEDDIVFSDIMVIDWDREHNVDITDNGIIPPQSGIPAAPGVLGVNARTGELTLVGSVHYKNTDVATDGPNATKEFGPISDDPVWVLYFKWGSLIGINGIDSEFFNVGNIAWAPRGYNTTSLMEAIGYPETDAEGRIAWGRVPFTDQSNFPENIPSAGLGDPCAYANKGIATARYLMPTGAPWNGGTFGNTHDAGWPLANGATYVPESDDIPAGARTADWSMFLPTAGQLNENTGLYTPAGGGMYWSSTPQDAMLAHGMDFAGDNVAPTIGYNHRRGMVIRCVREPELTVEPTNVTIPFGGGDKTLTITSTIGGGKAAWVVEYPNGSGGWTGTRPAELDWLTMSAGGAGGTEALVVTAAPSPITSRTDGDDFAEAIENPHGTENDRWNLASRTGGTTEETANCYIVNNPGYYSLPLAYGNAIKEGVEVTAPYIGQEVASGTYLKNFIRHDGKAINNSYIYKNTGFSSPITDATLVWQDMPWLVTDVKLDEAKQNLLFTIEPRTIAQGNAVIAVRDCNGEIMWSWHIWVVPSRIIDVDDTMTDMIRTQADVYHSHMQYALGYTEAIAINYAARSAEIRITQTGVQEPLSRVVMINQTSGTVSRNHGNAYYQWGRKDPMIPTNGFNNTEARFVQWGVESYGTIGGDVASIQQGQPIAVVSSGNIMKAIKNPYVFYTVPIKNRDWNQNMSTAEGEKTDVHNLWSINSDYNDVDKSVYDPSPVGFKVPSSDVYTGFTKSGDPTTDIDNEGNVSGDFNNGWDFHTVAWRQWDTVFFPAYGFRKGSSGELSGLGDTGGYWLAEPITIEGSHHGLSLQFEIGTIIPKRDEVWRGDGRFVRPIAERSSFID